MYELSIISKHLVKWVLSESVIGKDVFSEGYYVRTVLS